MSLSAKKRAPAIVVSSSAVARTYNGFFNFLISSCWHACKINAKKPFISQVPSPKSLSSLWWTCNGSESQRFSSKGTVSLCPASNNPPLPVPSLASILNLPFTPGTAWMVIAKPKVSNQADSKFITAWLLWSQLVCEELILGKAISWLIAWVKLGRCLFCWFMISRNPNYCG